MSRVVTRFEHLIPIPIQRRLHMPFKNTGKWTVRVTPKTDRNNYAPSFEFVNLSKTQARALIRKLIGLWKAAVDAGTQNIEVVEDPNGTINAFMPLFIQQLSLEQESEYVEKLTDEAPEELLVEGSDKVPF